MVAASFCDEERRAKDTADSGFPALKKNANSCGDQLSFFEVGGGKGVDNIDIRIFFGEICRYNIL